MKNATTLNSQSPRGFTLVEMLVSIGVVMVLMSLFTAIFSVASRTARVQRGLASNDQRARGLTTMIRRDFAKRTQRYVLPFHPQEQDWNAGGDGDFANRKGYLYISTNDANSYQDDLVQFTVDASIITENQDTFKYAGRATKFPNTLTTNPNQPEADDAVVIPNGIAESNTAEVMYFVRNGKFYRRVSLIREPLPFLETAVASNPGEGSGGGSQPAEPYYFQPKDTNLNGGPFDVGEYGQFAGEDVNGNGILDSGEDTNSNGVFDVGEFQQAFDFSAYPYIVTAPNLNQPEGLYFFSRLALLNDGAAEVELGKPVYRYGFNPMTGLSREHDNLTDLRFIGRFLQAETSINREDRNGNGTLDSGEDLNGNGLLDEFGWPYRPSSAGNGNPMDLNHTPLVLDVDSGLVTRFAGAGRGGVRRMEDLLLSNVHEFRVELWDERLQQFVTPAHQSFADGIRGDYHVDRSTNRFVGQAPVTNSHFVFDTWNRDVEMDLDDDGVDETEVPPPFIAYHYYPPAEDVPPRGPSPTGSVTAASYWLANTPYGTGDVVFGLGGNNEDTNFNGLVDVDEDTNGNGILDVGEDTNGNGILDVNEDLNGNGVLDSWDHTEDINNNLILDAGEDTDGDGILDVADGIFDWKTDEAAFPDGAYQIAYRCRAGGTSGSSSPDGGIGTIVSDGSLDWDVIDNRRPLQAIRLTIRYLDLPSDQIRQLQMVIPLTKQ